MVVENNKYNNLWTDLLKSKGHYLDEEDNSLFKNIFEQRLVNKGEFFIKEGDKSTEIGFVAEGLFRAYYIDLKGNDVTKYFYPEGRTLFSYVSYLTQKASTYDIQAIENSTILVAKASEVEKAMDGNYQLLLVYKKLLDEVLIMKEEHAGSFKLLDSTERYIQFLKSNPGLEERVKQHQLASYLGVTPVSLSRIRKKLNIIK
ncbi:Crp/Fnr family transcriptional regulator [Eubacteriaceae bacterium ES2]|nr:Crp/Fnr family transcriptional regulator [Eubacteriaceae bacterium ES2]